MLEAIRDNMRKQGSKELLIQAIGESHEPNR